MRSIEFREDQWPKNYQFILGEHHAYAGKKSECHCFLEAILWISRSGAQWRLLPDEYGHWNSIYKRFSRWGK